MAQQAASLIDRLAARFAAAQVAVVEPRVGVARVIRDDARYQTAEGERAQLEASK